VPCHGAELPREFAGASRRFRQRESETCRASVMFGFASGRKGDRDGAQRAVAACGR